MASHTVWSYHVRPTLPAFISPAFIRTDLIRDGPNSALCLSAEKREKLRKLVIILQIPQKEISNIYSGSGC